MRLNVRQKCFGLGRVGSWAGALVLLGVLSVNAQAVEKLTCEEWAMIADGLDDLTGLLENYGGQISVGDEISQVLGELLDELMVIAAFEQQDSLINAVDSLADAYDNLDGERFILALDLLIDNVDRLHDRDCV